MPVLNDYKVDINRKYDENITNKVNCNLIRAKTKIKDLALCNDFKYFITITVNPKFNRFNLDEIRKMVNSRIRKARFSSNLKLSFLFVPEQHKNGAYHLHGLLSEDFKNFNYINDFGFTNCNLFDSLGFNSIEEIQNLEHLSSYITKYVTKNLINNKFKHSYFASQNLNRPVLIKSQFYNNAFFNNHFFDFSTDFCYVKYDKKYYNFVTI